jgi:hypothetical protein
MRKTAVRFAILFVLVAAMASPASAQLSSAAPGVTAETEAWYQSGSPINLGGVIYYPSGPVTHFLRNEMVFTGLFERIPVYKRTTQEPGSVLYVPLAGGLVRPYERRRDGELAGTVGSSAPSFPVALPAAEPMRVAEGPAFFGSTTAVVPRPVGTTGFVYGIAEQAPQPVATIDTGVPSPVGTTGVASTAVSMIAPVRSTPARIETAQRPVGLNAVYVAYSDRRWFAAGPAVEFETSRFARIGDYHGFAVYEANGQKDTIYVSTLADRSTLVVPYKAR